MRLLVLTVAVIFGVFALERLAAAVERIAAAVERLERERPAEVEPR